MLEVDVSDMFLRVGPLECGSATAEVMYGCAVLVLLRSKDGALLDSIELDIDKISNCLDRLRRAQTGLRNE